MTSEIENMVAELSRWCLRGFRLRAKSAVAPCFGYSDQSAAGRSAEIVAPIQSHR